MKESRIRTQALPAILLLALVLRLPGLTESVWFDEVASTRVHLGDPFAMVRSIIYDLRPPFYTVFMFVWVALFGDSEVSIRMPSLVAGLASIAAAYLLADPLLGRPTALLTALLLAVSPVHIWYSQEARPYVPLLLMLLAALLCFYGLKGVPFTGARGPVAAGEDGDYAAREDGGREWALFLGYVLALLGAVMTHYYVVAYVGLLTLLALRTRRGRGKILLAHALVAACFLAFWIVKAAVADVPTGRAYLRAFTPPELWYLLFNWFALGNSLRDLSAEGARLAGALRHPDVALLQLFLCALFLVGLGRLVRSSLRGTRPFAVDVALYLFAAPALLLALTAAGFRHIYIERSLLMGLPFFLMVVAYGATSLRRRPLRLTATAGVTAVALAALVSYVRKPDDFTVYKPNPDWRSAAAHLARERVADPGPALLFTTSPGEELTYYERGIKHRRDRPPKPAFHRRRGLKERVVALRNDYYAARALFWGGVDGAVELEYKSRQTPEHVPHDLVRSAKLETVYFLYDRYWARGRPWTRARVGDPDGVLSVLMQHPTLRLVARRDFRGISVYKFRVVDDGRVAGAG